MLRISGLASGIDTDSIIKQMMDAQRIPLDKLAQKKQLLEWKRDDYRTLNNKILEFKNAAFDMKLQSSYLAKKATSSNDSVVSVSGSGSANEGQYSLKINQIATAPSFTSGALGTAANGGSTTIGDLGLAADTNLTITGPKGDATIAITTDQTIDSLVQAINSSSASTGMKASYDSTMDRLFFTSSTTGEEATIELSLESGNIGDVLHTGASETTITMTGTNAVVEFNGIVDEFGDPETFEYASNTFTISGMTFTAKAASTDSVNVTISQDIDSTVDTIKKFVEKYNSLIDEVNSAVSEKRERDFAPLTSAQKEEMSEDEIKKWEEKAKSGMLANDFLLTSGFDSLRRSLSDTVQGLPAGQLSSLAEIGISSTNIAGTSVSGTYSEKGKLYIDETKLKEALAANPEEVMAVFTADGATSAEDGIATRLYDQATQLFQKITDKAGTTTSVEDNYVMGKENLEISEQMTRLSDRLEDLETRYYKQFTAMETFISQMNSQSAWLTQQFSA